MARVAEQPAQLQPGHRSDVLEKTERVAVRIDAAAMEADVNLDEHVERPSGTPHRIRPSLARRPDDRR
jgi:hypothetical protein